VAIDYQEFEAPSARMEELLRRLLNRLERVGNDHEELHDTECREQMSDAIMNGFVRASGADGLRNEFGLFSAEGNLAVREALLEYVERACAKAFALGLSGFHDRLAAFQNPNVASDGEGILSDDFFGYATPESFDAAGNVIG
jgi:hypothetical protein